MFKASAEGARETFRVFYRGTAYDVIIFKFHGGGAFAPPAPLLTPMLVDAPEQHDKKAKTSDAMCFVYFLLLIQIVT